MYIDFHLPRPSVALVNNVWNCASTPPHIFRVFIKNRSKFFYVLIVHKLRINILKHRSFYDKVVCRRKPIKLDQLVKFILIEKLIVARVL